jgi:hypothetical protein
MARLVEGRDQTQHALSCNRANWRIIRPASALLPVVFCHNALEGTPV